MDFFKKNFFWLKFWWNIEFVKNLKRARTWCLGRWGKRASYSERGEPSNSTGWVKVIHCTTRINRTTIEAVVFGNKQGAYISWQKLIRQGTSSQYQKNYVCYGFWYWVFSNCQTQPIQPIQILSQQSCQRAETWTPTTAHASRDRGEVKT